MQTEPRTVYEIPVENFPGFEAKIAKLSKRALKLIGKPIEIEVIERYNRKESNKGEYTPMFKVVLKAETPKLAGWVFAATIDHSQEAGNIIRNVPNVNVAIPTHYRTARPVCDHCKRDRQRRDTFIVCHEETGELKQIGVNCIRDFLGHDPHHIARMAEWLTLAAECGEEAEEFNTDMRDRRYIDMVEFLENVAWAVRKYGFTSAAAARAYAEKSGGKNGIDTTREIASQNYGAKYSYDPKVRATYVAPSDEDKALAAEALEWARSFGEKESLSDYEHNVYVIAKSETLEFRACGLAASIVGVFVKNRAQEIERKVQKANLADSQFVGEVGKRQDFGQARVLTVFTIEGMYTSYLYTFVTDEGNVLAWYASKSQGLVKGDIVTITATVKDHKVYKDIKQTNITRAKIAKVETKEAA